MPSPHNTQSEKKLVNKKQQEPVHITPDIWFYVNKNSFDFVVWMTGYDGKRKCTQFRLFNRKIAKYLK